MSKEKKRFNKRKLRYGTVAAVITALFTAAVILLNILASQMTDRFGLKIDTTREQLYEISQDTKNYLGSLTEKVDVSVMLSEEVLESGDKYYKIIKEIIDKYAVNSENITVKYYDAEKNPDVVTRFNNIYDGSVMSGDVVVTCANRIKVIHVNEMLETKSQYQMNIKAEQKLTSAVMFVASPDPPKIAVLDVNSTNSVSESFKWFSESVIAQNGYVVDTVNPLTEEIDSSYSMVILPAPQKDLDETVIEKIDNYLYNNGDLGKNLFYIANFDQGATPNLNTFLEEWGISVGDGYIAEMNQSALVRINIYGLMSAADVGLSSIVSEEYKDLISSKKPVIEIPYPRPLNVLFDTKDDRETEVILRTSDTSAVITNEMLTGEKPLPEDTSSMDVLVRGSKHKYIYEEQISSNVIALGSALSLDAYVLGTNACDNQDFVISVINKFTGKNNGINILDKSYEYDMYTIDEGGIGIIRFIVMIFIPMTVAVIGTVVFLRRKNK